MTTRRLAATAATALLLTASLTACFAPPTLPGGGTPGGGTEGGGGTTTTSDLTGTSWGGADSDGDEWVFEFQPDGTVAVTFNGNRFDDATDTWALNGTTLDIHTVFIDGDYDFVGTYDGGQSIDLDGTLDDGAYDFTLTVTPQ